MLMLLMCLQLHGSYVMTRLKSETGTGKKKKLEVSGCTVYVHVTVTGGKPAVCSARERRGGTIFHTRLQKPERPRRLSQIEQERKKGGGAEEVE